MPKIAGTRGNPGEREHVPQLPSDSWTDGDARGIAHTCPDCRVATSRDASLPFPLDVTCAQCLSIRAEIQRRIDQSVQSVKDAEETGWYFKPVRPGWAKWRRSA